MTNWTRAHDAWIARELEGLSKQQASLRGLDHYSTDPSVAIRAAEAWRHVMPAHRGFWVGIDHCHDAIERRKDLRV